MRDSVREKWLEAGGWIFEYRESVSVSDIKIDQSANQQIRMTEKIDDAHVSRLMVAYKAGASLAAPILAPRGKMFDVGDGNHRCHMLREAGAETTDAYVVTNAEDDSTLELLRRTANAPNAKGFNTNEAARQAVILVQTHNLTAKAAAAAMQVSDSAVTKRLRVIAAGERIARLMPTAKVDTLSQDVLDQLKGIMRDDLFVRAVELAARFKVSGEDARTLFADARSVTTDSEAKLVMQQLDSDFKVGEKQTARKIGKPTLSEAPEHRLERALIKLKGVPKMWDNLVDIRRLRGEAKHKAQDGLRYLAQEMLARVDGDAAVSGSVARDRAAGRRSQPGRDSSRRRAANSSGAGRKSVSPVS